MLSSNNTYLSEENKNELLDKLKKEKEQRRQMIREGRVEEQFQSNIESYRRPLMDTLNSIDSKISDNNNNNQQKEQESQVIKQQIQNNNTNSQINSADKNLEDEIEVMKKERQRLLKELQNENDINSSSKKYKNNSDNKLNNININRSSDNKLNNININRSSDNKLKNNIPKSINKSEQKYENNNSPNVKSDNQINNSNLNEEIQTNNINLYSCNKQITFDKKNKKQTVIQELIEKENENLTFKPKINNYSLNNKIQKTDELFKDMRDVYKKREKERLLNEQYELNKHYPFKPKTIKNDFVKEKINKKNDFMDLNERLNRGNKDKQLEREIQKKKHEDELIKHCKYTPEVNITSKLLAEKKRKEMKRSEKSLHDNLLNEKKLKEDNLRKLRNEEDEELYKNYPFVPKINEVSNLIVMQKNNKNVQERLNQNKKDVPTEEITYEDHELTFQPQTNFNDVYYDKKNKSKESKLEEFYKRQQKFIENKEKFQTDNVIENNCSFKPKINVCSEFLIETNIERKTETTDQKQNRLQNEQNIKNEKRKSMQESYNKQLNFNPEINPSSKILKRSLSDIYYINNYTKEQTNDNEHEQCLFKPNLISKNSVWSKNIESNYSQNNIDSSLKNQKEIKQSKILALKQEFDYETIKTCTFKPVTNKNKANYQENVTVRGMDIFQENVFKKKQKEEELENRKKEVFGLAQGGSLKNHYQVDDKGNKTTITMPFNITKSEYKKLEKARKDQELSLMKECSFIPKTMESQNRKYIREVINCD